MKGSSGRKIPKKPFVGRKKLMERLEGLLEETLAGRGRIVTLAGEPGIGKTRVAEELCETARSRGMDVAWGNCFEGEGAPLYWPWSLVMRDLLEARGAAEIRKHLGRGAAAVAEVIPAVAGALPGIKAPKAMDNPAMARFRVLDSIASFFRRASAARAMVIVLDDLPAADEPTLALLSFLCRDIGSSRMLLVGVYRDVETRRQQLLEQTLGDLARERGYEQVVLGGLDLEDVRRYLRAVHGTTLPEGLTETVFSQTEGNPFLVTEVTRLLADGPGGAPASANHGVALPETVREVLGRRLDRLSDACRDFLAIAAGLGREFDAGIVTAVRGGVSNGGVPELVDEAVDSGMIEEAPGSEGRHRFGHVLMQQALLARLTEGERARLHARIAEALERTYGERVDAHARELVEHLEQARAVLGTEKLVHCLGVAGKQALAAYAWEDARELFARAVRLREAQAEDDRTADLLFGLGRAQSALSDVGAVASCSRAFAIYDKAGLVDRAVAVAASDIYGRQEQWAELQGMADRALALVEKDSLDEAGVLTQFASSGYVSISNEERRRRLMRALRIARHEHATALEMRILSELSWTSKQNLDNSTAVRYAAKELALANRLGDFPAQCRALYDTVAVDMDLSIGASVDKIRRDAEAFRAAAEKLRDRNWLVVAYLRCGKVAARRADWPLAKEMNRLSLAHLPGPQDRTLPHLRSALIEYQTCDFDAGDRLLAQAVEIGVGHPPRSMDRMYVADYVTRLAIMSGRVKWFDEAERFSLEILEDGKSSPQERLDANVALGRIAVIRGDAEAAAARYAELLALTPKDHLQRSDFSLGLIARSAGKVDDAVHHLHEAVELSKRNEHQGRRIWNQYFLTETLVQRSRPHDLEEAGRLLGDLLDVAARTGSTLVERRARALLETMSSSLPAPAAPAGPRRPDGLTEREVEVLRLIARGFTNTEIGGKLFISPYTVSTHVHRILEKTGKANRTEVTSYAIRNGLAEP